MSDIGVQSNLYERVRDFGDLIDEVIIALRSGRSMPADPQRKDLGDLLLGIATPISSDVRTEWFAMLTCSRPNDREKLARLGASLRLPAPDASVVQGLEDVARRLEQRRSETLAKLRGMTG